MAFESLQFGLKTSDVIGFTASQRLATEMQVTVSIANEASWLYKNLKLPRYRNSYGFAQIMSGAFVVREVQLQYLNQEILHWRSIEWGINETTTCTGKAIAGLLPGGAPFVTFNVPTRQRYTSVRIRLYPGVEANIGLAWETATPTCGGTVVEPDERQGQPITPNNGQADPGSRPSSQGGDDVDGSDNDGQDDPSSGKPAAPSAGNGSNFPCWHAHYTVKLPPACTAQAGKEDFGDFNNINIRPVYSPEGSSACQGTTFGKIRIGGAVVSEPDDIVSMEFFFY